jgi:hypothetical protein
LVTSSVDPIRLRLHPRHPHKEDLGHPPVQELKEQLETHLLAVDLVSHTQHSKSFSKKEKMKKKQKELCW